VVVLSGKDKGRQGTVLAIDGEKIVVENINKAKKHQKPNPQRQIPAASSTSDAAAYLEGCALERGRKKADRVGIKQLKDGKACPFLQVQLAK
jgi:large subunit ribosomal protein L24